MDDVTLNSILYVYDFENLPELKKELSQFQFASIGSIFHFINSVEKLESASIDGIIFDLTSIISSGNQNQLFIENYLWTMEEEFSNISFCIQSNSYSLFREDYPHLFDEKNLNFAFQKQDSFDSFSEKNDTPQTLYSYDKQDSIKKMFIDKEIVSLANLVEKQDSVLFSYDFEKIKKQLFEKNFKYIDISSMITTLIARADLLFPYEILIQNISSCNNIKFCVINELSEKAMESFPLVFSEKESIGKSQNIEKIFTKRLPNIDIKKIESDIAQINERLIGHSQFKKDFQNSLMKYLFLNEINERKILSLLLCGNSGVGKTEFAKILSNVLYPNEKLIKINFGNYSTEGVLNSLIGSPIGYVGSEEGGELINKLASSNSKIILIDEFEKATPSVYNFFYELLEDGKFTDRHGNEHNLNGYIIIFTSNMDEEYYKKYIPDSLKSRFDMVYNFNDFTMEEKFVYIDNTAHKLIEKLRVEYKVEVEIDSIRERLNSLVVHKNLREMKREIEDIIFEQFFKQYNRIKT
ncbi:AAA family ATPase [Enterococcus gilvus]|uniref:AAA family ATPase n=1 Tax=Enterococcus gilvus TaxID=160453 RepID=UPI00345E7EC3